MANTKVTGDLIASGTITAANLVSGTLDTLLNSYLTTNTYATQGYVTTAVNNLIDAAPASLDTLNELAAALNDDANFATTVTNALATKLNLSGGTLTGALSAPDFYATYGTGGYVSMRAGGASAAGYLEVFKPGAVRLGYIGYDTTNILYQSENNANHVFQGGNMGIGVSNPSYRIDIRGVSGNNSYGQINISGTGSARNTFYGDDSGIIVLNADEGNVSANSRIQLQVDGAERVRIESSGTTHIKATKAYGSQSPILRIQTIPTGTNYTDGSFQNIVFGDETITNGYLGQLAVVQENASASTATSMRFYTNSGGGNGATSEKMRINSSGNVGIGTASPTNGKLEIQTGATAAGLWVQTGGTTDAYTVADFRTGTNTPALVVKGNANVGIGTSSPTGTYGKLTVNGSASLLGDQNTKLEIGRYSSAAPNSYIKLGANSNSLRITNNNDTADLLFINNDGKVGFLEPNPVARIQTTSGGYIFSGGWGLFSSYTSEGLFSSNAQPNFLSTNGYNGTYSKFSGQGGLLLGYQDNGAGLYSPAYGFEVKSTDGRPVGGQVVTALAIHDIDTDAFPWIVQNNGSTFINNTDPQIVLTRSNNGTTPAARLSFSTSQGTVRWQIATNQAVGPGLEINQGNAANNRVYIDTNGRFFINRTSGDKLLMAKTGATTSGVHYVAGFGGNNYTTGYAVGIGLDPEGYDGRHKIGIVAEGTGSGWSSGKMHFLVRNAIGDSTEASLSDSKMTIDEVGRVSVGTTSTDAKFHVNSGAVKHSYDTEVYYKRFLTGGSSFSNPDIVLISNASITSSYPQISVNIRMHGRGVSANRSQFTEALATVAINSTTGNLEDLKSKIINHTTLGSAVSAGTFSISGSSLRFTPNRQTNYDKYSIEVNIMSLHCTFNY